MEEGEVHFRLLSRIVQRLHMPSLLYWGLGTSVYLHSSSDLWSQSQYYISVTCMPVKILYPCRLVDPDLPLHFCGSGCFCCSCPRTCQEVLPKHAPLNGKRRISHLRYFTRCSIRPSCLALPRVLHHQVSATLCEGGHRDIREHVFLLNKIRNRSFLNLGMLFLTDDPLLALVIT